VVAHRGESSLAPENTLLAGRLGRLGRADAWEVDVQLSRDGVPIVLHDDSLARTTDVARRFPNDLRRQAGYLAADFDLDEIQSLDAGSWFLDPAGGPRTARAFGTLDRLDERPRRETASGEVRVPTLADVLRLTVVLDWFVNVELKSVPLQPAGLLDAVLRAIAETGAGERVWLSSFDHAEAAHAAAVSTLPVGVLAATPLHRPARYVREAVGALAYHPSVAAIGGESLAYRRSPRPESLRSAEFEALAAAGVPVFVYTVNAIEPGGLADVLAEAGVRGVFTDRPSALAARWAGA
jgi:glycerophosphoryl diester phosphodiesterase